MHPKFSGWSYPRTDFARTLVMIGICLFCAKRISFCWLKLLSTPWPSMITGRFACSSASRIVSAACCAAAASVCLSSKVMSWTGFSTSLLWIFMGRSMSTGPLRPVVAIWYALFNSSTMSSGFRIWTAYLVIGFAIATISVS